MSDQQGQPRARNYGFRANEPSYSPNYEESKDFQTPANRSPKLKGQKHNVSTGGMQPRHKNALHLQRALDELSPTGVTSLDYISEFGFKRRGQKPQQKSSVAADSFLLPEPITEPQTSLYDNQSTDMNLLLPTNQVLPELDPSISKFKPKMPLIKRLQHNIANKTAKPIMTIDLMKQRSEWDVKKEQAAVKQKLQQELDQVSDEIEREKRKSLEDTQPLRRRGHEHSLPQWHYETKRKQLKKLQSEDLTVIPVQNRNLEARSNKFNRPDTLLDGIESSHTNPLTTQGLLDDNLATEQADSVRNYPQHLNAANASSSDTDDDCLASLPHLTRTRVEYEIMSNKVIPFDQSSFAQAIYNPMNRRQILTVQKVIPAEGNYKVAKLRCTKDHQLTKGVQDTEKGCILCNKQILQKQTIYTCEQCQDFTVCLTCKLKHLVRRKILGRNSHTTDYYHLEASISQFVDGYAQQGKQHRLQELGALASMQRDKTIRFANIVQSQERSAQTQMQKKHAVVTLWHNMGEIYKSHQCYMVHKPLYLQVRYSHHSVQAQLLHESLGELFFFSGKSFDMHLINLHSLQGGTKGSQQLPIAQTYRFSSKIRELLEYLFAPRKQIEVTAMLQLIKRADDKIYLVVKVPLALDQTQQWVRTANNNLIIINLQQSKVVSIVYDALCFISFKNDMLTFLKDNSIDVIRWTSPVLKDKSQPILKSYSIMLPMVDSRGYSSDMRNLNEWLSEASKCGSLISTKHHNDNVVTVIYHEKGVLRMSLKQSNTMKTTSDYRGHIGKLKDFQLFDLDLQNKTNFKQKGSDSIGDYTLYGKILSKSWHGYFQNDKTGHSQSLDFECFELSDGIVIGNWNHEKVIGVHFLNQVSFKIREWTFKGTLENNLVYGKYYDSVGKIVIGSFHIQKAEKNPVEIDINYTDEKWIHLQGDFISSKNLIQGKCTVSPVLEKTVTLNGFYTDFQLINVTNTNSADVTFKNNELRDGHFCHNIDKPDSVLIAGNLIIRTQTTTFKMKGFSSLNLTAYDMAEEKPVPVTLICHMLKNFKQVRNEKGMFEPAPYTLLPFVFNKELDFTTTIYFKDTGQNYIRTVFIRGKPRSVLMKVELTTLPQQPPEVYQNYCAVYPIIAHKSELYTDNEIVICNTITKQHKSVNLDPFTFVQFFEMGLVPEHYTDPNNSQEAVNTSIFMLVQFDNRLYVMVYRCYPWPVDPSQVEESKILKFQFQDQLQLLAGDIDLECFQSKFSQSHFRSDTIVTASMLQVEKQNSVQNVVVLQMINQIVTFKLNKKGSYKEIVPEGNKLLQLRMQMADQHELFFAEKSKSKLHTVICLKIGSERNLQRKLIYKSSGDKIIAIQLESRNRAEQLEAHWHYLFILQSNMTFRRIVISGNSDDTNRVTDLIIDLSFHPDMRLLMNSIRGLQWTSPMMNEKGIIVLKPKADYMEAVMLSTKSDLNYVLEFPALHHDYKLAQLKKLQPNESLQTQVCLVAEIPWIDKHLFQVNEATKSYFLITQHTCQKQIDFARIDVDLTVVEDMILLGNAYIGLKLKYTNQYVLFRQKDLQYDQNLRYSQMRPLTTCIDSVQYFLGISQLQKHSVLKIKGSKIEVVLSDAKTDIESITNRVQLRSKLLSFNEKQIAFDFWSEQVYYYAFLYQPTRDPDSGPDFTQFEILGNQVEVGLSFVEMQYMSTLAIIWSDAWCNPMHDRDVVFSRDFMIIKHGSNICFAKKEGLNSMSRRRKIKFDSNFVFSLINTLRIPDIISSEGFKLTLVESLDIRTLEKSVNRKNVLQISFKNLSIAWDLDADKEVAFIDELSDFQTYDNYTVTGFKPHLHYFPDKTKMNDSVFMMQNESRSFILTPKLQRENPVLFRTFTYINMIDIMEIRKKQRLNLYFGELDFETVLQNINGLSFFQIFPKGQEQIKELIERIKDQQLQLKIRRTPTGKVLDNLTIRRLYWTLNLPLLLDGIKLPEVLQPSIVHYAMFFNPYMLDYYLMLLLISRERKVQNLISNFVCLQKVYSVDSQLNQTFIGDSFITNLMTQEINTLLWKPGCKLITFGAKTSLLSANDIRERVAEEQSRKASCLQKLQAYIPRWLRWTETEDSEKVLQQVEVKLFSVEWLYENQKDFYYFLADIDDTRVYDNELINILLEQQNYNSQLITKFFVPQLLNTMLTLSYLSYFIPQVEMTEKGFLTQEGAVLRVAILLLAIFNLGIEAKQMRTQKWTYLTDQWNYVVVIGNVLQIFIIFEHSLFQWLALKDLIIMGSIAVLLQWVAFFYWLRLFPGFAFYVTMVNEVITSLKYFMLLFLCLLLMCANSFYAINQIGIIRNRDQDRVFKNVMYQKAMEWPFVDSCVMIFKMIPNSFDDADDNFTNHPAGKLAWLYFFFSSLMVMIFVTMIIAIVTDTYARVNKKRTESAKMEQTQMYRDFMWSIQLTQSLKGQRYLYIVQPRAATHNEDKLQIAQSKIIEKFKAQFETQQEQLNSLQSKMMQLISQQTSLNQDLNQKIKEICKFVQK